MALHLQTQVYVDGQWVTRTVDAHTLLQEHNQMDDSESDDSESDDDMETITHPFRGILTQTIIQSPLDTFVEIRRLGVGPHLYEVIRKDDFGSRIRNACVLGSLEDYEEEQVRMKEEPEDDDMINVSASQTTQQPSNILLPPQILVLQLETDTSSDSVFLMLHQSNDGSWKFISSRRRLSKAMDKLQPGMHLSIDPSSRYMAIGGSEKCFTIQSFSTRKELNRQHAAGEELRFIESERVVLCKGAILKLAFLHPPAGFDDDIILLLIMAINAVYKGILEGAPERIPIGSTQMEATRPFRDSGTPLWTAWAKPTRLPQHTAQQDDVYLAREDGSIYLLEINYDKEDPDITPTLTDVGEMQCNIGQAFACLDYSIDPDIHRHGDVLVSGGDASIGGTYLITARAQPNVKKDTQNWSPAMDLVVIKNNPRSNLAFLGRPRSFVPVPDSIYVCSGKGSRSSITELRYGIEAILGLTLELSDFAVSKAWIFPSEVSSGVVGGDDWILMTFEDKSAVLSISLDRENTEELDQCRTQLDWDSRTIVAGVQGNRAIQVTEQSIVILNSGDCTTLNGPNLMGFPQASHINDAIICNEMVLFTTHHREQRLLRILEPTFDDSATPHKMLYAPKTIRGWTRWDPEVTCIGMCNWGPVVAEKGPDGEISLSFIRQEQPQQPRLVVPYTYEGCSYDLQALSSIAFMPSSSPDHFTLLCGTVTGLVISLYIEARLEGLYFLIYRSRCDRFGGSVATLTNGDQVGQSNCVFVNCDEKIFRMNFNVSILKGRYPFRPITKLNMKADQIWLMDALDTTLLQPNINSVSILPLTSESSADTDLLMVSSGRLLFARMGTKRKTVPRRIQIKGTPYRIIYSETRNAFVVGASTGGQSTLYFIDPQTGEDLSEPKDGRNGTRVHFAAGLGTFCAKILCIYEWLYSYNTHTWNFIIVCTSDGRVLIISTEHGDFSATLSGRAKIPFWTVTQFKNFDSVYSVTGDSEGLYYCAQVGTEVKLYYSTLNKEDKRFNKNLAEVKLLSPAISLSYDSGKIYALTRNHSLQILEVIKIDGKVQLRHTHTDHPREALSYLEGRLNKIGAPDDSLIDLVSDRAKSVVGLCATSGLKIETIDTIFEAQLPASVLRFRSANCRPVWDCSWKVHKLDDPVYDVYGAVYSYDNPDDFYGDRPARLGAIHNDEMNSDTLGLGIDGSLYHFTMLDGPAWDFLKFLVNLARSSGLVGGRPSEGCIDLEPEVDPHNMQVDGDILRRVLENQKLEEIFRIGQHQTDENKRQLKRFCELLILVHGEELDEHDDPIFYIERAYDDLEVLLRPVI